MASVVENNSPVHSPPPNPQRPRGILKKSFQRSPPTSPTKERSKSDKEITIENTNYNAGHRRSSSGARPAGSRRQSGHSSVHDDNGEPSQRLKWDEANLYLTEQERSPKMKIDEPKTPYAKHYDPSEDPSDGEEENPMENAGVYRQSSRPGHEDDIPGLSLGEPEEAVPEGYSSSKGEKTVHVEDESSIGHSADEELAGMSPEEREKHRKFEQLRKKHYEMRNVAQLLGHPEDMPDDDDDEENGVPPVPRVPNGSA